MKESKLIRRGKGRNRRSRKNLLDSDKEEDEIKEDNEVVEKREIYENRGADNNNNKE